MQDVAEVRSVAVAARAGQPLRLGAANTIYPANYVFEGSPTAGRCAEQGCNVRRSPCKKVQDALWSDAAHYRAPRFMSKPDNSGFEE